MNRLAAISFAILLAGCTHDLTAPLDKTPVVSMADYFWNSASQPATFTDSSGATITDNFSFRDTNGLLLAEDANANGGSQADILCRVSSDTVFAQGFVPASILNLDGGSYFTSLDTLVLVDYELRAAAIGLSDSIFVASDTGVFASAKGGPVNYDSPPASDVDALTSNGSKDSIFAGTRSGQIWVRANHHWSQATNSGLPAGAITALAYGEDNRLYAVVEGNVGAYQLARGATSWLPFTSFMTTKQITAIRSLYLGGTFYLCFGTIDGWVGGYPLKGSGPKFQQQLTSAVRVNDLASGDQSILHVATDKGVYTGSPTTTFQPASALTYWKSTISLAWDATHGFFLISNGSVVNVDPTSGPSIFTSMIGKPLSVLDVSSQPYLLTDSSFYTFSSGTWTPVAGFPRRYYPHLEGGLVLLRSNPLADSSWRAGTLVVHGNQSYPITARLLGRLDTLTIKTKSYPDVLVMRYAHELAGGVPDSTNAPYWVIYYQRGRGPVMFDKMETSSPGPTLLKRREIAAP